MGIAGLKHKKHIHCYKRTYFVVLCLQNNDVSGLNDHLPLYKLQICLESCYNPPKSVFRGWLSMKFSLETLNLEINLKTFTHVRLISISYTPYSQHPSLPLSKLKLFLKHMPVMYVILLLTYVMFNRICHLRVA